MSKDKIGPGLESAIIYIKVSPIPTFIFDDKGDCVHINDAAIDFLGYELNDLDEDKIFTFVKSSEKEKVVVALEKELANPYALTVITKNNDEKYVDAMGVTVTYDEKKYRFSTVTDRTEITVKKKELEEINEKILTNSITLRMGAISDLLFDISHQWKQPLSCVCTTVTGIAAKLRYNMYSEEGILGIPDELDRLDRILQDLSRTIDDFISLSSSSKIKKNLLLSDVFNDSYNVIKNSLNRSNISLNTDYESSTYIKTYENDLRQIFTFLLKNSDDAFNGKGIENPKIFVELKEDKNNQIFTISDNAGGIDESIIDRIFEPYFTTKHKAHGTGLALYHTKKIVEELFKGTINVKNTNDGAKFTITIPY